MLGEVFVTKSYVKGKKMAMMSTSGGRKTSVRSMMAGNRAAARGKKKPYANSEVVAYGRQNRTDKKISGAAKMTPAQIKRMQKNRLSVTVGKTASENGKYAKTGGVPAKRVNTNSPWVAKKKSKKK